jgi:hypothetical protein
MPGELTPHDAAMVAKVDAVAADLAANSPTPIGTAPAGTQPTPAADKPVRPEHIPEKFWDADKGEVRTEDLLKSYKELESGKTGEPPKKDEQATEQTSEQKAAADAVKGAGLDMTALQAEFDTSGALSEDSLAKLEKSGISREMVASYIEGQNALAVQAYESTFALVGGKESYSALVQWAAGNLPAAEQAAFNSAIGDPAARKSAVLGLKAQMDAAVGKDPKLALGASQPASGDAPFASRAEVTAAMRDPRYKADPAYRAMVERRIGAMEVF